jgi:transitional endoplasmic reticulum ATPase
MKQLLKDIGGLLELQASIFGMVATGALCLGWLWALFSAWFQGRPILYSFEAAASPEDSSLRADCSGTVRRWLEPPGGDASPAWLFVSLQFRRHALDHSSGCACSGGLVDDRAEPQSELHPFGGASFRQRLGVVRAPLWSSRPKAACPHRARRPGDAGENEPARVYKPQTTFASICGNDAIKQRLKDAAAAITAPRKFGGRPRNGILLHGAPGNGKTVFAEALAGELCVPLVTLTFADVASQWVGEKSSRVRQAFEQAKHAQPCVLFLDEVDSFLEARDGRSDGVKEDRDLTNALLTLMVDIRQQRVILMAATNHMDRLDAAAVREGRFDFKVEITPPDAPARLGLLWKGLKDNLPGRAVDESVVQAVAQRWNGFSVKRILAVTEELPVYLKEKGSKRIEFDDFMGALRQLQGQRGAKPENVKPLSELLLSADTRESLELIAGRMADPEHTERHGGTLPTGVLFSGPPGTGKTATAKALAADLGWGFLPATGAELARDPAKLQTLYTKAQDLRPAIIFIDEADELLRSREFSPSTDATNKLLTLMDGVGDRVRDVVWVAATNHPEGVDAALLRGGRFTEKVRFELPDAAILASFVQDWLGKRKVQLAAELSVKKVAALLGEQSIADAEAILQAALNRAVARRTTPVVVTGADVGQALRTVAA